MLGAARARGRCLKSPKTFWAYFGCHNSLYIFATPRFWAMKLRNHLGFSHMLKITFSRKADCSLTTSLLGPKSSPDFRETGPRFFRLRLNGKLCYVHHVVTHQCCRTESCFPFQTNSCSSRKNSMVKAAFSVRLNERVTFFWEADPASQFWQLVNAPDAKSFSIVDYLFQLWEKKKSDSSKK